ncbi:hypothetical protein SCACP_25180 [Sporomusa carbonis]
MKRIIIIAIFTTGVMCSLYCICSDFIATVFPMTDEQYAHEAESIVNYTPPPFKNPEDTVK